MTSISPNLIIIGFFYIYNAHIRVIRKYNSLSLSLIVNVNKPECATVYFQHLFTASTRSGIPLCHLWSAGSGTRLLCVICGVQGVALDCMSSVECRDWHSIECHLWSAGSGTRLCVICGVQGVALDCVSSVECREWHSIVCHLWSAGSGTRLCVICGV